jgi:hypothetical protein
MIYDIWLQAVVAGSLFALGIAAGQLWNRLTLKKKHKSRLQSLHYRREVEPVWGRAADLRGLRK